ncbi:MAG: TrbI/VirB10 family protein [Alphaproteobacteria bacterium]
MNKKTLLKLFVTFQLSIFSFSVHAADVTAIDFVGNIIGKVLPDGRVINLENNILGKINVDSQIINQEGDIIGGIIPQGIAIGNDFKVLGRPSSDGQVLSSSGSSLGKVLPNSLVVNNDFEVIGAVLFPGLIYSNSGEVVGRLNGEGVYTDIKGTPIGFITPDGYAYKSLKDNFILDGKLISSKMVFSLDGNLIGSLNPNGAFVNLSGDVKGKINANEFVYDDKNQVVGQLIKTSYAFDFMGNPLGFISYDGKVLKKTDTENKISYNNIILDKNKKPIGFSLSSQATATDLKGRFLGIVLPTGEVVKGSKSLGFVSAKSAVVDSEGEVIGKVIQTGPVFDYKSTVVAHALASGNTYNLNGAINGSVKNSKAYDLRGLVRGIIYKSNLVFSNDNEFLGLSNISNKLKMKEKEIYTSNYGYVFDDKGELLGQSLELDFIYNQQGNLIGSLTPEGVAQSFVSASLGTVAGFGFVIDELNKTLGKVFVADYFSNTVFFNGLLALEDNLVRNKGGKIEGKILPDTSVVLTSSERSVELMPVVGTAYSESMVVSYSGALLGYVDYDNFVKDLNFNKIGVVASNKIALDNNGYPIGEVVSLGGVLQSSCSLAGVIDYKGEVKSFRDILLGKILPQGKMLTEGIVSGYSVKSGGIIDNDGITIGYVSNNGQVYNSKKESLGCLNAQDKISSASGSVLGSLVDYQTVMSFNNSVLGRTILDGSVVNENSKVIGHSQLDYNVSSSIGEPIGVLLKYRYAFDNNNKFLGVINSKAQVIDASSKIAAEVFYDGSIVKEGQEVGYALYDLYMYNKNLTPIGYVDLSGDVYDFKGVNLGKIQKGFLTNAKGDVLARPNRDYYIRDSKNYILGELAFDGQVLDSKGNLIGELTSAGEIVSKSSKEIVAVARPLQYFSKLSLSSKKQLILDSEGNVLGYAALGEVAVDEYGNIIGKVLSDGTVVDENGNVIGRRLNDGKIIDTKGKIIGSAKRPVYDKDGNIVAYADQNGKITDERGNVIGQTLEGKKVYDKDGNLVGTARADGSVVDANGKEIGFLDENGNLVDANGNIVGGVGRSWYEKVEQKSSKKPQSQTEAEFVGDSSSGRRTGVNLDKYLKAINIALTPDGEFLGEILEDGTVLDKNGKVIGRRQGDGLIIGEDGELKGIEEVAEKEPSGEIFIPVGDFGNGGAFGTGDGNTNLGPGGGFAPGERYSATRAKALATAQLQRRQEASVGGIKSGYNPSSFNYTQDKWDGVTAELSSWKVDMSEMILADKPIPAVLARSIYSTSTEVPVTAYVERSVYSEEGRNIIIPAGSRLIGKIGGFDGAASGSNTNATKVEISWDRIIRPDGVMFNLSGSITGDAQGRQGAIGYVDQNLVQRYLSPILFTSLTSASAYLMAVQEDNTGEIETSAAEAASDARENFLDTMDSIFQQILSDATEEQSLIFVPAGTRITVYPNKDLWLRTVDRDLQSDKFSTSSLDSGGGIIGATNAEIGKERGDTGNNTSSGSSSAGTGSQVVYESGTDAQAQSGGSTSLLSSGSSSKSSSSTQTPVVITAPSPPDSSSASSSSSSSSPTLF